MVPCSIYSVGNSHLDNLRDFIRILSEELISEQVIDASFRIKDHVELVPIQPGNVPATYADIKGLEIDFDFKPNVD